MGTHLDRILAETRRTVALRKSSADIKELERRASEHTPRGFAAALKAVAKTRPAVIAELKKASPSKGLIRENFDPSSLAKSLEDGGAACLSVLTDEPFFQGSLHNLELASAAVRIPCLRKDFMVDAFQMMEARAHCADAVLLIAAALSDAELQQLRAAAKSFDLDVLCEVHTADELTRVQGLGCEAYGVNSRDLSTFSVDLAGAESLAAQLPAGAVRVAESGIHGHADIQRMQHAGYDAFLIGESLMRQPNPGAALRDLLQPAAAGLIPMWVKICANTNTDDARLAAEYGADAVGFVFAASRRQVTAEQVAAITPHLPAPVEKIGVFYQNDADEIVRIMEMAGLTGAQLHDEFRPALVEELRTRLGNARLLQTIHWQTGVSAEAQLQHFREIAAAIDAQKSVDAVLIDSQTRTLTGGTGVTFDWNGASDALRHIQTPVLVAGGLNPENVAQAIAALEPWGVDVATGVEYEPGRKDSAKLRAFIENAKQLLAY